MFALKVRPKVQADYRAVYRGDEFNAPRTSDAIRIRVAVIVRGRLVNSYGTSERYHLYQSVRMWRTSRASSHNFAGP